MSHEIERPVDQVFENPGPGSRSATYLFLGGIGLIGLAIAGFLLAIRSRHGQLSLHLTTTLPTIIAIGLLARGFSLRSIPRRIVVGPDTLEIATKRNTRRFPWSEIGSAATANVLNSSKSCLRITDTAGRTIVRIDESFAGYDRLVKLIESSIDAKPDDTSIRLMARKAKRTAVLAFGMGCLLGCAAIFTALETRREGRARELLASQGIPGTGEIIRRFVAPNGVTKRIEYRVAGSAVKNVEVHPVFWDRLEHSETVAVLYVPDQPDISQLSFGEIKDDDFMRTPRGGYLVPALGGLMALFMLGFSPIAWMGYDLALDKERQIWKVKRYGRVIWASKKEAV